MRTKLNLGERWSASSARPRDRSQALRLNREARTTRATHPRLPPTPLREIEGHGTGALALLRDNLLVYGLGGSIVPFVGIKRIDLLLTVIGWV